MQLLQRSLKHSLIDGIPAWAAGFDLWKDYERDRGNLPAFTDTHSGTIYSPNRAGIYTPYVANQPVRSDLGIQTVPTRTQLSSVNPVDFTSWSNTNLTPTAAATVAPDGTLTGSLLDDAVASGVHSSATGFSAISGTTYTASFLVKNITRRYVQILFGSGAHGSNAYANYDLQAGVLGTVGSAATATITAVGSWYLITCTAPATVTTTGSFQLVLVTSTTSARAESYAGTNQQIYAWSGQCEAGAFAASRILTASATVNGNQQVIDLTGRLGTGVAGIVQVNVLGLQAAGLDNYPFNFTDGTALNRFGVYQNGTDWKHVAEAAGVYDASEPLISARSLGVVTFVFAISANYRNVRRVGSADAGADTTVTMPTLNRLEIGWWNNAPNVQNEYAQTTKLALSFGPQDATTFDSIYKKAVIAHNSL